MRDQFDQSEQPAITRIDLWETPDGLLVLKFKNGWTASTRAVERYVNPKWTLDMATAWLEENGWKVRRWGAPGAGARAWMGKELPVRTAGEIQAKRARMENNRQLYPGLEIHCIDFAFER